jgi:hypothetical protein
MVNRRLEVARSQAPAAGPFIVVLDHSSLPVSLPDLMKAARKEFQPDRNTRISAVAFLRVGMPPEGRQVECKFVTNPFAKFPVPPDAVTVLQGKRMIVKLGSPLAGDD